MEVFFRTQNQFHITNEKIIMVYAQSPREDEEGGPSPQILTDQGVKICALWNFSNLYVGPQTL